MSETAIHAGSDAIFATFRKLQEKPEVKHEVSVRDQLARLEENIDRKAEVEFINKRIEQLKNFPIDKGDTVESLGFKYLATHLVIEYLEEIRDLPLRAKKVKDNE